MFDYYDCCVQGGFSSTLLNDKRLFLLLYATILISIFLNLCLTLNEVTKNSHKFLKIYNDDHLLDINILQFYQIWWFGIKIGGSLKIIFWFNWRFLMIGKFYHCYDITTNFILCFIMELGKFIHIWNKTFIVNFAF